MNLQTKAVVTFNGFIILVCLCMGLLGYRSADNGFGVSLQMKAVSNVQSVMEIIQYRYPGGWHIENGSDLYKGDTKINGNNEIVDFLGKFVKVMLQFSLMILVLPLRLRIAAASVPLEQRLLKKLSMRY